MKPASSRLPTGWFNLPDEIKLKILSYALPFHGSYGVAEFRDPGYLTSGPIWDYHNTVLPLLSIPQVRDIVSAEFHGNNNIGMHYGTHWIHFESKGPSGSVDGNDNINDSDDDSDEPTLFYPPQYVRPHLRRFEIIVNEMTPTILNFLVQLGTPAFALDVLETLSLTFSCAHKVWYYSVETILQKLNECGVIRFPTRRLKVVYQHHAYRMVPIAGTRRRECKDILEMPLLEKLSLKVVEGGEARVEENWKRFSHHSPFEEHREYFDAWPSRKLIVRDRTTVKIVEVM